MKNIVKIYIKKLTNKNYAARTIEVYTCYLEKYLQTVNKNPYHITTADIKNYLENRSYTTVSQQNQVIGALKLFAKFVLGKKQIHLDKIERPRRVKNLPKVIDAVILKQKINAIQNLKHKAILMLGFTCMLRVSEVLNLQPQHIDRQQMLIHIKNAKGGKNRVVKLSQNLLQVLEQYYRAHRPLVYLFNGQNQLQYTAASCNKLVKKYIGKQYHFHNLRHSGATAHHENGTDIAIIQKLLGHSNIKTTMVYTQTSTKTIQQVQTLM